MASKMASEERSLRLVDPTDFLILEALTEHGRNVAPNLEHHTGKTRKNINNRLPELEYLGLVQKIGPASNSGLYEITEKGELVLEHRDQYEKGDRSFDEKIESLVKSKETE